MFQNLNFCVIECGVELSQKRAVIVKELIVKHGGKVTDKLNIDPDSPPDFVISTKNLKIKNLIEIYKNEKEEKRTKLLEVISERVYAIELITNSVRQKMLLDKEYFKIDITTGNTLVKRINKGDVTDMINAKRGKNTNTNSNLTNNNIGESNSNTVTNNTSNNIITSITKDKKVNLIGGINRMNEIISITPGSSNTNNNIAVVDEKEEISISNVSHVKSIKSNSELFQEIQNNIMNLRKMGKEEEIFSSEEEENEIEQEEDTNTNTNSVNLINPSQYSTQSVYSFSNFDYSQGESMSSNFNSNVSSANKSGKNSSKFSKFIPDKAKFAFNEGTSQANLNSHITSELDKILDYHTNENNVFEALAYRKAIAQLKNAKEKITSCDQMKNYKYLGKSIGNKIKEIILTGKLKKSEYLSNDTRNKALKVLTSVWGIGKGQANNLYRKGIRSIEDLRKNQNLLNQNQKIGLQYYEDFQKRIPREEIEEIIGVVKEELYKILPEDRLLVEVCGSFRRGKATCGILI